MISFLIITKNEQDIIEPCLESIKDLANEIVILDNQSTDSTVDIAKKYTNNIHIQEFKDFSQNRNYLASVAKGNWLFYIDADEKLPQKLKEEINRVIKDDQFSAFAIKRKNILLGKWQRHGGWWPDYQVRLFKRTNLKNWQGKLHESPVFDGRLGYLEEAIEHLTHRNIASMITKTLHFSDIESKLLFESGHTKVTWKNLLKVTLFEFVRRYFLKHGFKDGTVGLVEAIYQAFNKFIIYTRLWEFQNKHDLDKAYKNDNK